MFAVHTLVAEDNAMDAEKAFVTLTVLGILNKAQAFLPFSVHCIVQVRCKEGPDSAHLDHRQQRTGGKGLEYSQTPTEVGQRVQGSLSQHPGECVTFTFRNSSWAPLLERGPLFLCLLSFPTHILGPAEKEED